MVTTSSSNRYKETIRELSDSIVAAQAPIRILDAIKWDTETRNDFFKNGFKKQPAIDLSYYENRPLGYDTHEKYKQFHLIEREITRRLGHFNPVGQIMRRMCREYSHVIRMLEARGTPEFSMLSEELYGSSTDVFHEGDPNIASLGCIMAEALKNIDRSMLLLNDEKTIGGEEAIAILQERLNQVFSEPQDSIRVLLSDGIVADAAAGADYIKLRKEAKFSIRDLRILEVHEGWVHLGTTLNGMRQPS